MKCRVLLLLAGLTSAPLAAVPETLVLSGQITNTTQDIAGTARFELAFEGDRIRGFLATEAPLAAGRWAVEGTRRGAWCEIVCQQTPKTRLVFRGLLSATELRGTYISGGGGELVQYGRFRASVVSAATDAPAAKK